MTSFSRIVEQAPEMYKALEEIACYSLRNNKIIFDNIFEMKAIAKKLSKSAMLIIQR